MVLTVLTLSVGFKGGEVVPSFYIGATFGCVVGPLLGLPAGFSAAVGLVCVSVSYTHLDVYKRQAFMRACTTAQKLLPASLLMPIVARQQKKKLG